MRSIKTFIASSIDDLGRDRLYLRGELETVNNGDSDIYYHFCFCENAGGQITLGGSQNALDEKLLGSDLAAVLFNSRIGEYTVHELEIALEKQSRTGSPYVMLFFREDGDPDPALKQKVLDIAEKYGCRAEYYSDIAAVKELILQKIGEISGQS